jgi:ubiquinone/menaquinone biosynthesis C-methylase UbiE
MAEVDVFKHSTPELYDRYMVPLLFEPYARLVADRIRVSKPARLLETAAGTGVLTELLSRALPEAEIIATDVNPGVVDYAGRKLAGSNVAFEQANAQELSYGDDSFDAVLCQFGVMFFPDKVKAGREARRVLRPGGQYLLVTFAALKENPVPQVADDAINVLFSDDPPRYMERGPFSYTDPSVIDRDLREAGFEKVSIETIPVSTRVVAREAASGMVLGSPFRAEIERRDPEGLPRALDVVTEALASLDGQDAPVTAHLATAEV